jgi:hypothetical protein
MILVLFLALQSAVPPTPPCAAAEHRQFDFWIGDWEVRGPRGQVVGYNRITSILGGCALREEWTSADGRSLGSSHNAYSARDRRWHQEWVDNAASRLSLVGGLVGTAMVMEQRTRRSAADPEDVQRITWTPFPDGRVRQHWEASTDGGTTWTTAFDGTSARRPAAGVEAAAVSVELRQEIVAARDAIWRAWFGNDRAVLEAMLPEDFVGIGFGGGPFDTRASALHGAAEFAGTGGRLRQLAFADDVFQATGDIVAVFSNYTIELDVEGGVTTQRGRATEIFAKRGGRWVNTAWHLDSGK